MKNIKTLFTIFATVFAFSASAQTSQCGAPYINDTTVCDGTAIGGNGTVIITYPASNLIVVTRMDGSFVTSLNTFVVANQNGGNLDTSFIYTVWGNGANSGCQFTDTFTVRFRPSPPALSITSASGPAVCGDTVTLNMNYSGTALSTTWQKLVGSTYVTVGNTPSFVATAPGGTFKAIVSNGSDACSSVATTTVSISGKPQPYLHDTAFCAYNGENFAIGDNVNSFCTYLWNQGNTGDDWVINPSQVGTTTYWVTITNANGCSTNDTITTTIYPAPNPQLNSGLATCGEDVVLRDYNTSYDHVWKFGSNVIGTADTVVVNTPGTYTVKTTSANRCSVTNNVYVFQAAGVNVDGINVVADVNTPRTFSFSALGVSNVTSYNWNFGDGSTSNSANPVHEFTNSDTSSLVTLTVSNSNINGDCGSMTISLRISTADTTNDNPNPTSVTELENNSGLKLFPNPVSNQFNVSLQKGKIENVTVLDLSGRVVYNNNVNASTTSVQTSGLTPGFYLVKINVNTGNGTGVITKKINKL